MNNADDMETPVVEVEEVLQPILPEFINNRRNDCTTILELVGEGNFGEIRRLGHRMKGTGGSYGFDAISEIGEAIENAALEGNQQTIRTEVQRLSDYLERVVVVYV
ncbi:MAG: Hpt domain-containing protein [Geobacter sp.]|nr:Hpt domain-containing protein [Geobacter sp.]